MGSRRWGTLGAALLVLIGALFFAVRRTSERGAERAGGDAPQATVPEARAVDELVPADPATQGASARTGLASRSVEASAGSPAEQLEVRVSLAGGEPAPGAQLCFVDWDAQAYGSDPLFVPPPNRATELAQHGLQRSADANGRALVPVPKSDAVLTGRLGETYGQLELLAGEPGPVTLELAPDPPVCVRVVDRNGAPAPGVPVALKSTAGEAFDRAETDARGLAVLFGHEHCAELASDGARVALDLLLRTPVEAAVDLASAAPAELVLPETGSAALALRDAAGKPWTGPARFSLWFSERGEIEVGEAAELAHGAQVRAEDGETRIAYVGLGLDLVARASTLTFGEASRSFAGPTRPGETVTVSIVLGPAAAVVVARLMDPARQPIGPARLRAAVREPAGRVWSRMLESDTDGRIRMRLVDLDWLADIDQLELEVRSPRARQHSTHLRGIRLHAGENDLGEIVLEPTPLLASGRVVDAGGAPLRSVLVTFVRHAQEGQAGSGERLDDDVLTDARGRFELRKSLDDATIGLLIRQQNFLLGPRIVPVGTHDVELVALEGGTVAAHVLFESGSSPLLGLLRDGSPAGERMDSTGDGSFTLGPVPPGTYSLAWSLPPWSDAHGRIDGLVVRAGETTHDPGLEPLDLRGATSTVTLHVLDPQGTPVPEFAVGVQREGAQELAHYALFRDGLARIAAAPLPLRVRIEADGFRTLVLEDVRSDRRVELEPGPLVRFEITGALPALPRDWKLVGTFEPTPPSPSYSGIVELDLGSGVSEFRASTPGKYRFTFGVVRAIGDRELEENEFEQALELEIGEASPGVLSIPAPGPELTAEILAYIDSVENR